MLKKKSTNETLTWSVFRNIYSGALTKSGLRKHISPTSCLFAKETRMGGQATKKATTGTTGNTEENVNVGLLNISSNSQSILSMETILEVLSFIILTLLVIRWMRKCLLARKLKQEQRMITVLQPNNNSTQQTCQEMYSQPQMTQPPLIGLDKYR